MVQLQPKGSSVSGPDGRWHLSAQSPEAFCDPPPPPPVCAQLGALLAWAAPWVLVSASSKCARVGSRGHSQAALSPALLSPCLSDFPSQLSYDTYTSFLLPLLTLSDLRALLQAPSSRKPSRLLSPSPYSFSSLLPSPSFYCLSSK